MQSWNLLEFNNAILEPPFTPDTQSPHVCVLPPPQTVFHMFHGMFQPPNQHQRHPTPAPLPRPSPPPFLAPSSPPFLRYQTKAQEAEQKGTLQVSNVVGSGRDVMARHADGTSLRIFLMVQRLDRASGRAADCLFLGTMIPVAEGEATVKESARSRGSRGSHDSGSKRSGRTSARGRPSSRMGHSKHHMDDTRLSVVSSEVRSLPPFLPSCLPPRAHQW